MTFALYMADKGKLVPLFCGQESGGPGGRSDAEEACLLPQDQHDTIPSSLVRGCHMDQYGFQLLEKCPVMLQEGQCSSLLCQDMSGITTISAVKGEYSRLPTTISEEEATDAFKDAMAKAAPPPSINSDTYASV
eukprot:g41404.t1